MTLTVSPTASTLGQPVTLNASIPAGGGGSVTFYDGVNVLGISIATSGQSAFTTTLLTAGSHSLRARYNGDGSHAAATSGSISQTVTARASFGFQVPVNYPRSVNGITAGSPFPQANCLAVSDLNRDGRPDVVSGNGVGITVLLGSNGGGFRPPLTYDLGVTDIKNCLAVGDFNGDGTPDLAVVGSFGLEVLIGKGDGTFQIPARVNSSFIPDSVVTGDFNSDGIVDLAVVSLNYIFIFRGVGDGSFMAGGEYGLPCAINSVAIADFNADGRADLALGMGQGSQDHSVAVLLGDGGGGFQTPLYTGAGSAWGIAIADFNGDGHPDIAGVEGTPGRDVELAILLGNGDGTFALNVQPIDLAIPGYVGVLAVTDFNGDGKADLAMAGTDLNILMGRGDGTFGQPVNVPQIGVPAGGVVTADFSGDGEADLVVTVGSRDTEIALVSSFSSPLAKLSVGLTRTGDLTAGSLSYTVTISNSAAAAPSSGAIAAVLYGSVYSASGTGWTCSSFRGDSWDFYCTRSDILNPGASYPPITAQLGKMSSPTQSGLLARTIGGSSVPASGLDTFTIPGALTKPQYLDVGSDAPLKGAAVAWTPLDFLPKDVYFGTYPPMPLLASDVLSPSYTLPPLQPCTFYFWRVVAKDATGSSLSSDIATFLTVASVSLNPAFARLSASGGSGSIQIGSPSDCWWKAQNSSITLSPKTGLHDGVVNYSLQPNSVPVAQNYQVTVADKVFWIRQEAGSCPLAISGPTFIDAAAQSITLPVTAGGACSWNLWHSQLWLHFNSNSVTGNAAVKVDVEANTTNQPRTAGLSTLVFGGATPATLFLTQRQTTTTFADVAADNSFFDAINLLRSKSVTGGCSSAPLTFCPNDAITRGQMAVFIVRSMIGSDNFSYSPTPHFGDVPTTHPFFRWIQKLSELGITGGCVAGQYCPESPVTRGQMAVFIIRSRFGTASPSNYPPTPLFSDVSARHPFFPWIQKMGQIGITSGCGSGQYCPDDSVTRSQMATFVMRGEFNQLLPAYTPVIASISPSTASAGQTVTVTITGQNTNFQPGDQVDLGPGVFVSNVLITSPTTLTAQLTIAPGDLLPASALGPHSVTVTTPGSIEATLPNGFIVQ